METYDLILTKEVAERIDELLKKASATDPVVNLSHKSKEEEYEHMGIIEQVEKMELVTNWDRTRFIVTPKGFAFIKEGGFTALHNEKQDRIEREQRQDKLTQAQIRAEKRQPYLIAWGAITTISTLILAWLQLCKP